MKRKLFLLPILTLMLLASCNNSTPAKHHFNVGCVNCTANFESSLSLDFNENEYVTFKLLAKENYLLPVDIKVTSGNEVLMNNVDYFYTINDDRLSGEVSIKANRAVDIYIEADDQGYLYIGNNKVSRSGDYSIYDLMYNGEGKIGSILYDYKTNTLTFKNCVISAKKVSTSEYTIPVDTYTSPFSSLISWTGGGTLNVNLIGINYFMGDEEKDNDCAILCPFLEGHIDVSGPGVANFVELEKGTVVNTRGGTSIKDAYFEIHDAEEFAICSRELQISNSHLILNGENTLTKSVGIYADTLSVMNSYMSTNGFMIGGKVTILSVVDSFIDANGLNTGLYCDWIYCYGHLENNEYTSKIHAYGESFGISTYDAMEFVNSEVVASCGEYGYALLTVDTEIAAYDSYIYAEAPKGQGIHAFHVTFVNSNVIAKAENGIGIITSLHGAQGIGREHEPVFYVDNSNIEADGEIAIYGYGHAEIINCTDETPKYLEVETNPDVEQFIWAYVPESETELHYNEDIDPYSGEHYYFPTNALKHVSIFANSEAEGGERQRITYNCDPEKTARYGLGKDVTDKTSYRASDDSIDISGLRFYNKFGREGDKIELEYVILLHHRVIGCPVFTIVIVDKDGNEIGAFKNHYLSSEGIYKATFTKDDCIRGDSLAIHSFIEDYKETGLQNYQVYLESITID